MATYKTTTEQLTSIANAIRAKTGSSESLVYPTGFVSAIGDISGDKYDTWGKNPQLIQTYSDTTKLSETNWDNVELSTSSAKKILDSVTYTYSDITSLPVVVQCLIYVNYQYQNNAEPTPRMICTSEINYCGRFRIISSSVNFSSGNSFGISTPLKQVLDVGINSSGNQVGLSTTNFHNFGIYPNGTTVSTGNSIFKIALPSIYVLLSSSFPQTAADLLDKDKTTIFRQIKVYEYEELTYNIDNINELQSQFLIHNPTT